MLRDLPCCGCSLALDRGPAFEIPARACIWSELARPSEAVEVLRLIKSAGTDVLDLELVPSARHPGASETCNNASDGAIVDEGPTLLWTGSDKPCLRSTFFARA
ncbi:hypothetical protein V8E36_009310 [Tilletia maclaganii]